MKHFKYHVYWTLFIFDAKMVPAKTRPDTWLSQSRAGGQGSHSRSLDHLGRSSEAKDRKNPKKVKCDGPTDGRTDKAECRVA